LISGIFQIITSMNIRLPARYPKLGVIPAGEEALYGLLFLFIPGFTADFHGFRRFVLPKSLLVYQFSGVVSWMIGLRHHSVSTLNLN
jgi:hypothetical protein